MVVWACRTVRFLPADRDQHGSSMDGGSLVGWGQGPDSTGECCRQVVSGGLRVKFTCIIAQADSHDSA